jgi:hypothetical protein
MIASSPPKLLPRNVGALRKGRDPASATHVTIGNPVSTRLESGIGNFFPGLECDMRNLERRFFPFLEVDTDFADIVVAAVDVTAASAALSVGTISAGDLENYRVIQHDIGQKVRWSVRTITGDFGPLGSQTVTLSDLDGSSFGGGRKPPDAWVAIRMLKELNPVTLTLSRTPGPSEIILTGPRTRYLDDDGALSRLFEPGELTQSLCSPWTHDFRDCACFYWASNHPDIALPPLPDATTPGTAPKWNRDTAWERSDRSLTAPPVVTIANGSPSVPIGSTAVREMQHHEINRDWQLLNFVLERREQITPYQPSSASAAAPFADKAALLAQLRYAAGVELAVMLEYLSAAWSLRRGVNNLPQVLRDDVRTAFTEMRRIAIGEMLHLRAVNDLLSELTGAAFEPALAVATAIPLGAAGQFQPLQFRAAVPEAIDDFVSIEAPSQSIDGLYSRIFATLAAGIGTEEQIQSMRAVMSEGGDHFQTFLFIKEWLGRHTPPSTYLVAGGPVAPPAGSAEHATLQQRFVALLSALHDGLKKGIPAGAPAINAARSAMLGPNGIEGALDAVAAKGFLVTFDPVADPRFASIAPP